MMITIKLLYKIKRKKSNKQRGIKEKKGKEVKRNPKKKTLIVQVSTKIKRRWIHLDYRDFRIQMTLDIHNVLINTWW